MTDPLLLVDAHLAGPLGRTALIIAQAEIGAAEDPPGSNRGPRVEVYQRGYSDAGYLVGARWCARFARWCIETAARQLGQPSPFAGWKSDLASAYKWREQGTLHRSLSTTPAPGRVGIHMANDGSSHGHVVLVARVDGQYVVSIGGNEADAVRVVRRPLSYYSGGFVEVG